jgi:hypothetical protein
MPSVFDPTTDVFVSFVHEDQQVAEVTRDLVAQELKVTVFMSSRGRSVPATSGSTPSPAPSERPRWSC